jgi:hypothetical protein
MASQALVGPLPTVRFQDGTKVAYTPPKSTMDNRWRDCTEHRVACDCREAELAEIIAELRGELDYAQQVAREVLAGHPTYAYEDGPNGEREVGCMCTGCQIARKAYLLPHRESDSSARDEVDGLDPDQVAAGLRWKVCLDPTAARCPTLRTRARLSETGRPFHEHLMTEDGVACEEPPEVPF